MVNSIFVKPFTFLFYPLETLIAHFSKYGDVKSAVVITEPGPEGKSKGYGFVNYFNVEDRDKALGVSHELDGRPVRFDFFLCSQTFLGYTCSKHDILPSWV